MKIALFLALVAETLGCGGPQVSPAPVPPACFAPVTETDCGVLRELADGRWVPCVTCSSTPVPGGEQPDNDCLTPGGGLCVVSCSQCGE